MIKNLFRGEYSLLEIIDYYRGMYRYYYYYNSLKFLIRKHIKEQIQFRVNHMDNECYAEGSCKLCGCMTIALQMANKACKKPCYPTMMNKKEWEDFKKGKSFIDKKTKRVWSLNRAGQLIIKQWQQ